MEQCNTLKEYATFIDTIRLHIANGESFETAIESSVDECIHSDILANVLRKNRAEVIDVILEEYDETINSTFDPYEVENMMKKNFANICEKKQLNKDLPKVVLKVKTLNVFMESKI